METKNLVKVNPNKVYRTEDFEHCDDIIEFIKNRYGIKHINSLEFDINYYHEKEGVEYEAVTFKVRWGEIPMPVIRDGKINVKVPITVEESKPSRVCLSQFDLEPKGSILDDDMHVKVFQNTVILKEWLRLQSKKFIYPKINHSISTSICGLKVHPSIMPY